MFGKVVKKTKVKQCSTKALTSKHSATFQLEILLEVQIRMGHVNKKEEEEEIVEKRYIPREG
ncbi:MAG TPA: hypothetical protein VGO47_09850 [Chlamydiales bacterium]|nr:hypothetical protein [Chlamydiales bacterium]